MVELLQVRGEALQVLVVGQDGHRLRTEEVDVPDGQKTEEPTGRLRSNGAVRECSSIAWKPASISRNPSGPTAIIVDTPQSIYDPPACLSDNLDNVWNCATPWNRAFNWRYLKLENTASADSGAPVINLSDDICPGDPCPAVLHDMIVYRDVHHLTATFALSLTDHLGALLPKF